MKIRSLIVITAEISSILLIVGFIFSVIVNQYVFDRWGLNFLQIATVNDVILGGLMYVADMIEGILPLFIGIWVSIKTKDHFVVNKYFNREDSLNIGEIFAMIAAILYIFIVISKNPVFDLLKSLALYFIFGFLFTRYYFWLKDSSIALKGKKVSSRVGKILKYTSFLISLPVLLMAADGLIPSRVGNTNGSFLTADRPDFVRSYNLFRYAANFDTKRCRRLAILWSGERAVIAACNEPAMANPEDIVVLLNPQQLLVTTRSLHPQGPERSGLQQYSCAWPIDQLTFESCKPKKTISNSKAPPAAIER